MGMGIDTDGTLGSSSHEAGLHPEVNHRPTASNWRTLSHTIAYIILLYRCKSNQKLACSILPYCNRASIS